LTKYDGVIDLGENHYINFKCPLATRKYRRLLYFIKDPHNYTCKRALIIPFINDKKVEINPRATIT